MSLKEQISQRRQALDKGDTASTGQSLADQLSVRRERAEDGGRKLQARVTSRMQQADASDDDGDDEQVIDEALQATCDGAIARYEDLMKRVQMTDMIGELSGMGNTIAGFPEAIHSLRTRGYHFHDYLEGKIEVIAEQWDEIDTRIDHWLEEESAALDDELAEAQKYRDRLDRRISAKRVDRLETALNTLETQVDASEGKIKAAYDALNREVQGTQQQIRQLNRQLDWLDAAHIDLHAGEHLFMAAEAEWDDGRDKPEGFIYVTDQRILFEQREKKGGMLGFGGKKVQELLWEVAHGAVEAVRSEKKGMMGGKDMMSLDLAAGAPYATITCEIKGGIHADKWAQQLQRAVKGQIQAEKTEDIDAELLARLREAPTECPNCGSMLPKLMAGASDVTCQYCGYVLRI